MYYDFQTTIRHAWLCRYEEDAGECDYWDDDDRAIVIISPRQYKVILTNEVIKVNPTTPIYGRFR